MYIETTKAKRYWTPYISFFNYSGDAFDLNKALVANFHPNDSINPVYKRRPNTVDDKETTSGKYFYLMSEVVHKIIVNKDDIKAMLADNRVTTSRWNGLYEILATDVCKYYNKLNNTEYSYCNLSGYTHLQGVDWVSNSDDRLAHFGDDLPEDWKGWIEVFLLEDFKLITDKTASEIKYIETKQRQDANIALHNTFLKDEMNRICEELGLYYQERTNSYKFEVRTFREFMLKAVQQLICDKLKEHGINIEPSQDIKKIRSSRVMIEYLRILEVGDLKMEE
jgi:hypothetical protein